MKKIIPLLFVVVLLENCTTKQSEKPESYSLGAKEFDQKFKETSGAVLLDVRRADEFQSENLAGAINIDFNSPEFNAMIEPLEKDKPYFVYCLMGSRSSKAADLMRQTGFKEVYQMEGGINAWKEAGLPTSLGQ